MTLRPRIAYHWRIAVALFVINVYFCRELFYTSYIPAMSSVEGSFISISRYAMNNFHDLEWFPLWFSGMPFLNVYQPGLHLSVAVLASVSHVTPALVYHAVTGFLYCLGPVTFFYMCCQMSTGLGSIWTSAMCGLIYSVFSPSALVPTVMNDLASVWYARRFQVLTAYGEGPHVGTLTLIPLAILFLHRALFRRRPIDLIVTPVLFAAIGSTNWTGTIGLALGVAAYFLAYSLSLGWRDWALAAALGLVAYGLAAPFLPPSAVATVLAASQHANGHFPFTATHLAVLGGLLPLIDVSIWLLKRLGLAEFIQFTLWFTVLTGGIFLVAQISGFALLPQPHRWHLEMEMGLIATFVFSLNALVQRLPRPVRGAIIAVTLICCAVQIRTYRWYCGGAIQPIDITKTSEYHEAKWFDSHMNQARVFVPGSVSLWMNIFTDTPQFAGCCDQGLTSDLFMSALYGIYHGEDSITGDAANTIRWLKAYGVQAVAVSREGSTEPYKPFRNAGKFDGVLPVAWRERGDTIYRIPQRSSSLAHAMYAESLISKRPIHGLDTAPLVPFIRALDDVSLPLVKCLGTSRHSLRLTGNLTRSQRISVQENYEPRWRASVNGSSRKVSPDALGMIVIDPQCSGPCTIDLVWDNTAEKNFCAVLQAISCLLLMGIVWLAPGNGRVTDEPLNVEGANRQSVKRQNGPEPTRIDKTLTPFLSA